MKFGTFGEKNTNSRPGKTLSRLMDKAVADEICDSFIYKW